MTIKTPFMGQNIINQKKTFQFIKKTIFLFSLFSVTVPSIIDAAPYSMRTIPENGLNVNWPVLKQNQYFSYKGRNAHVVTLKSIISFNCQHIMDRYDEDPYDVLEELELLILVQLALLGVDIRSIQPEVRADIAKAEISKRLRQFGRIKETKGLLKLHTIVPSIAALCHVAEEQTTDMLKQKFHVNQQWDLHKVDPNPASDKDKEYKFNDDDDDDSEDGDFDY